MAGTAHADNSGQADGRPASASDTGTEARAAGTPDEYSVAIIIDGHKYGNVFWDDYDGSTDKDDVRVRDREFDGQSIELKVYRHGTTYSEHAYSGETKTIGTGNLPKGERIYFSACGWDNGKRVGCTDSVWFRE